MFAVIKTGGKQYRVKPGDVLEIEKLEAEKGAQIDFEEIMLIEDEDKVLIGTPFIENALVTAEVLEGYKDDKIIVFKKKRRKQYRKTRGHRQELIRVRIERILTEKPAGARLKAAEKPKVAEKPEAEAKVEAKAEPRAETMPEAVTKAAPAGKKAPAKKTAAVKKAPAEKAAAAKPKAAPKPAAASKKTAPAKAAKPAGKAATKAKAASKAKKTGKVKE